MTEEVWKQVPGYAYYDVSTHGRVRSWNNNGNNRNGRRKEALILKITLGSTGYPQVTLCKHGERKPLKVHFLVLTVFISPRPPGLECCHADGDRTNNQLSNLRWDTHAANVRDAIAHGTAKLPPRHRGEDHSSVKLTEKKVGEIRTLYAAGGITYRELGARFGVNYANIGFIVRRKTWAHIPATKGE